jgi:hypothetical protein
MKAHVGFAVIFGAMLGASNIVQAQSSAPAVGNGVSPASRTTLNAELSATVDSKKAKAGDAVTAQITEAVKEDGKTVIPKGSKLLGRVTQASARSKGDSGSSLAIQFDKAVLKNGQEIPLSVWIRAIAAEPRGVYEPGPEQNTMAGTPGAGQSPMGSGHNTMGGPPAPTAPPVGASTESANAAGGSPNAAERTAGAAGGLNAAGQLTANSRGVFGLEGVHLATDVPGATQGTLITSSGKNVRLDSGTRLLLVVLADSATTPSK